MEEHKGVQGDVVQNISSLYFTSPLHFQHTLKRVMNILYTHHLTSHTAAPYVTAPLQTCTQSSEATPQLLPQIKQGSITNMTKCSDRTISVGPDQVGNDGALLFSRGTKTCTY